MIGELASTIPAEGGFYVWVRRALGPFWGYQEGWLSLSASIFDMAIYPAIFVLYLGKLSPALTDGWLAYAWPLAVVAICCAWNLRGAPAVGEDSVWMFVLLLAPFVVFMVLAFWRGATLHPAIQWAAPASESALSTGVLVALWNYMGWDNASTVAQEVENPQRNYPRAMIASTCLVAVTYILPIAAMAVAGLSAAGFTAGDWVQAASSLGGPLLGFAVVDRRSHHRHRHVQRAGHELYASSHGHGRRGNASAGGSETQQPRRSVGERGAVRPFVGTGASICLSSSSSPST